MVGYGGGTNKGSFGGFPNPNPGRFPANLIHDGSAEVEAVFPATSDRPPVGSVANVKAHDGFDGKSFAIRSRVSPNGHGDSGSASRFFYCPKADKSERAGDHPTVKPLDLMRYLTRLVTPPGGIILDPFAGSGSTGVAALQQGFRFLGFDLDPHYAGDICAPRLEAAAKGLTLQEHREGQETLSFGDAHHAD
jgi:site-specific DNA-methyltransferase (adenine-specific)